MIGDWTVIDEMIGDWTVIDEEESIIFVEWWNQIIKLLCFLAKAIFIVQLSSVFKTYKSAFENGVRSI